MEIPALHCKKALFYELVWASDVSKQLRLKKTLVMFCLVGLFRLKVQWNLDLTESLRTCQICSLNGGFVISKTSI